MRWRSILFVPGDRPDLVGTSELSADLRFGTLSPRTVAEVMGEATPGRAALVRQLAWRDWYAHLLHATPSLVERPMKDTYAGLRWRHDPEAVDAWRSGRTGFPLVDAGMRQLLATGWMHNRVRMLTASFLVKNLLVDWRVGEQWFWDTLVDADEANNPGNWQWVAGSGADAAPYFRVFNPELQAKKFDPDGTYVNRWVPEAGTPDYPEPMVDLAETRREALAAYDAMRAN